MWRGRTVVTECIKTVQHVRLGRATRHKTPRRRGKVRKIRLQCVLITSAGSSALPASQVQQSDGSSALLQEGARVPATAAGTSTGACLPRRWPPHGAQLAINTALTFDQASRSLEPSEVNDPNQSSASVLRCKGRDRETAGGVNNHVRGHPPRSRHLTDPYSHWEIACRVHQHLS